MVDFVRHAHSMKLGNYSGGNVDYILRLLYDDDDDDAGRSATVDNRSVTTLGRPAAGRSYDTQLEYDDDNLSTHNIAHGLHFASIAMLGVLVLEVSCRSPALHATTPIKPAFHRHRHRYPRRHPREDRRENVGVSFSLAQE